MICKTLIIWMLKNTLQHSKGLGRNLNIMAGFFGKKTINKITIETNWIQRQDEEGGVNRQSREGFRVVKILYDSIMMDKCHLPLSKSTDCTTLTLNSRVNYGLSVIAM